jgi:hypothetical protein
MGRTHQIPLHTRNTHDTQVGTVDQSNSVEESVEAWKTGPQGQRAEGWPIMLRQKSNANSGQWVFAGQSLAKSTMSPGDWHQ